jgi:predicted metal-dependent hydrolase
MAEMEKYNKNILSSSVGKGDLEKYKNQALSLVTERLNYFNQFYNFTYGTIRIRNQKTRWGSCSKRGNLSFNYKIALLSPELADYIIVHELCHIGQFNHSQNFWNLVGRVLPNYQALRHALKHPIH